MSFSMRETRSTVLNTFVIVPISGGSTGVSMRAKLIVAEVTCEALPSCG